MNASPEEKATPDEAAEGRPIDAAAIEAGLARSRTRQQKQALAEAGGVEVASAGKFTDDGAVTDALPDDLDAAGYVGPYMFPNNNRRRVPGILYIVIGLGSVGAWLALRSGDPVLINPGVAIVGAGLVVFGLYCLLAGWNLDFDEQDALVAATRTVGFPVGHASAQLGWRGLASRPTWRILLYSAENPPATRGLVLVDGVDGTVLEWFTEDNPEDWSELE